MRKVITPRPLSNLRACFTSQRNHRGFGWLYWMTSVKFKS